MIFNRKIKSLLKFTNLLVKKGKKSKAVFVLTKTLFLIKKKKKKNPINYLYSAIKMITPGVTTRRTIVAGRLYHLPASITNNKALYFGCNWFQKAATHVKNKKRKKSLSRKLCSECFRILRKKGNAYLSLKQHNKVVSNNRPFLRFIKRRRSLRLPRKVFLRKRKMMYLKRRQKNRKIIPENNEDSYHFKLNDRLNFVRNELYKSKIRIKFENKLDKRFLRVDKKRMDLLKLRASKNKSNVRINFKNRKFKSKKFNKKNKF